MANDMRRTPFSSDWWIVAGRPPGSPDCLARSKSESMICPEWCNRMSAQNRRLPVSERHEGRELAPRTLWLEIPVNEAHEVQVLEGRGDLRRVEASAVLR